LNGPLLIASNHPNSFLDAVIIDILFVKPVWSLARGDAFINKRITKLLHAVQILPVYRTTEGVENLSNNYDTFNECVNIFRKGGLVQIFSEGQCFNEWHLRKLKKGTARLANQSWDEGIDSHVLPVGINYSSYKRFGKNIFVNFGNVISGKVIDLQKSEGLRYQQFNNILENELKELVYEIDKDDMQKQKTLLVIKQSIAKRIVLFLPAGLGWLLHAPLYLPINFFVSRKHINSGHFDSILITLLVFSYPIYLLLITFTAYFVTQSVLSFFLLIVLPFCAWAYVQIKPQLDRKLF
jgi:hypothetical protein